MATDHERDQFIFRSFGPQSLYDKKKKRKGF